MIFEDISFLSACTITGTGTGTFRTENRFQALTCIGGSGELQLNGVTIRFRAGESLAIPACVGSFVLSATDVSLLISSPSSE